MSLLVEGRREVDLKLEGGVHAVEDRHCGQQTRKAHLRLYARLVVVYYVDDV